MTPRKQVSASPFHEVGNVDATPAHVIRLDRARAMSRRSKGIGATA